MVINILSYSGDNHLTEHPCGKPVKNTASACIGWTYKNGQFIEPPRNPNPPPLPERPKTQEQTDIAALKSDIQTLTQSLSQVITALNALTKSKVADPNV
jgi:hypothetical protein